MAGFPLYTDADVRGPLIKGLRKRGWDIVRAVEAFPEGTSDEVHFEHAAKNGRCFVTSDPGDPQRLAHQWVEAARRFRMVTWDQDLHQRMSDGDFIRVFDWLATHPEAFNYPVYYITGPVEET